MPLQICLPESGAINAEFSKQSQQVLTRVFKPVRNVDCLRGLHYESRHFKNTVQEADFLYKNYEIICTTRYEHLTRLAAMDKMHTLELLGVGRYAKPYTVQLDFKDELAYFLHLLSGCKVENIRTIENYKQLSRSLLTYDQAALERFNITALMGIDPALDSFFVVLLGDVSCNRKHAIWTMEDVTNEFVYKFYITLMDCVSETRDYVAVYMCSRSNGQMVYRSKSYSDAILSSNDAFTEPVIVSRRGIGQESMIIHPPCSELYQYAFKEEPDEYARFRFC